MEPRLPVIAGVEGYSDVHSNVLTIVGDRAKAMTAMILFLQGILEDVPPEQQPCLIFDVASDVNLGTQVDTTRLLIAGESADPIPLYFVTNIKEIDKIIPTKDRLLSFDFPLFVNILETRCRDNKIGILPFSIRMHDIIKNPDGSTSETYNSHSNILILDPITKTIERYEPNGPARGKMYNPDLLNETLRESIEPHGWKYISPLEACPLEKGEDIIMHYHMVYQPFPPEMESHALGGFCMAYSLFYAVLRSINPEMSRGEVLRYLTDLPPDRRIKMVIGFWTNGLRILKRKYGELPIIKARMETIDIEVPEVGETKFIFNTPSGMKFEMTFDEAKRARLLNPELVRRYKTTKRQKK